MDYLVGVLSNLGDIAAHADDDQVDRLSHRYTTFFLVIFAILVSTKQYVGDPINCWVPAQFTDNHEEYTNKVCWVSNTYYVSFDQRHIPDKEASKEKISYYQWIPMILVTQAVLFYVPCIVWRVLNKRSGLNLKTIVDAGVTWNQSSLAEARERSLRYIVHHVDIYLTSRRDSGGGCWGNLKQALSKRCFFVSGVAYGNYLTCVYLSAKVLYIAICVGQLFMLNVFLDTDYHLFGIRVARSLLKGEDWRSSVRFPRITMCDFEIRTLGNVHHHTVQCVLPINLFNEKIFVFIWFWFVFVALVTALSFLQWLYRSTRRASQEAFISRELIAFECISPVRDNMVNIRKFIVDYLHQDGIFVLRILVKNAGNQVCAEVLASLWDIYVTKHRMGEIQSRSHRGSANNSKGNHL